MKETNASFAREVAATATLIAAMIALNIVTGKSGMTLTVPGQLAYVSLFVVIAVAWRRFSAAVDRDDLVASCLAGITFAVVFIYLIDAIVGGTFVLVSLFGHFKYGADWPRSHPMLLRVFAESILVWLAFCAGSIIWRLRRAVRTRQSS
jgi:hypothetical protein